MKLARYFFGSQATTATHSVQLDDHAQQWAGALAGLTSMRAEAQREYVPWYAGEIGPMRRFNPVDQHTATLAWNRHSLPANAGIMPVDVRYIQGPQQMAPRVAKQMKPYEQSQLQALALRRALVTSMLTAQQRTTALG